MNLKKGAMFGLDARIALAIFGALSVISGAALYSVIQDSKVTSAIADLNEINKAIEAYMLDTGSDLPMAGGSFSFAINAYALVENVGSVSGWNGPYLAYNKTTGTDDRKKLVHNIYDYVSLEFISTDPNPTPSIAAYCTSGKPCYYWTFFWGVSADITNAINERIDNDGTLQSGRVKAWGGPTSYNVAVQGPLKLTQP